MPDDDVREVVVRRLSHANHEATNVRGGTLLMGTGDTDDFTPVELLLAAIAGCTGLDVDFITSRRAEPESFAVAIRGRKVRDDDGNHIEDLEVTFDVASPRGAEGDAARAALPMAVFRSHDRLCTVSRTVELGAAISTTIAEPPAAPARVRAPVAWTSPHRRRSSRRACASACRCRPGRYVCSARAGLARRPLDLPGPPRARPAPPAPSPRPSLPEGSPRRPPRFARARLSSAVSRAVGLGGAALGRPRAPCAGRTWRGGLTRPLGRWGVAVPDEVERGKADGGRVAEAGVGEVGGTSRPSTSAGGRPRGVRAASRLRATCSTRAGESG